MVIRPRWWLVIRDITGLVLYVTTHWTRRGAEREARAITTPYLNSYEIRKGDRYEIRKSGRG